MTTAASDRIMYSPGAHTRRPPPTSIDFRRGVEEQCSGSRARADGRGRQVARATRAEGGRFELPRALGPGGFQDRCLKPGSATPPGAAGRPVSACLRVRQRLVTASAVRVDVDDAVVADIA